MCVCAFGCFLYVCAMQCNVLKQCVPSCNPMWCIVTQCNATYVCMHLCIFRSAYVIYLFMKAYLTLRVSMFDAVHVERTCKNWTFRSPSRYVLSICVFFEGVDEHKGVWGSYITYQPRPLHVSIAQDFSCAIQWSLWVRKPCSQGVLSVYKPVSQLP